MTERNLNVNSLEFSARLLVVDRAYTILESGADVVIGIISKSSTLDGKHVMRQEGTICRSQLIEYTGAVSTIGTQWCTLHHEQ